MGRQPHSYIPDSQNRIKISPADSVSRALEAIASWIALLCAGRLLPIMNLQKSIPVLTSIAIILLVAFLRDRSRAVAAVLATMPINIPLALWVVSAGSDGDPRVMAMFVRSVIVSLVPSFIWLFVVFLAVRNSWNLFAAISLGYAVWAALVAGLFYFGVLSLPN